MNIRRSHSVGTLAVYSLEHKTQGIFFVLKALERELKSTTYSIYVLLGVIKHSEYSPFS